MLHSFKPFSIENYNRSIWSVWHRTCEWCQRSRVSTSVCYIIKRSKIERLLRRKIQDYISYEYMIESLSNSCYDIFFFISFDSNSCWIRNQYWERALRKSRRSLQKYKCRRWVSYELTIISFSTSRTFKLLAETLKCYSSTSHDLSSASFQKISWKLMMTLYLKDIITKSSDLQDSIYTSRSYWESFSMSKFIVSMMSFSITSTILCCSSLTFCLSF